MSAEDTGARLAPADTTSTADTDLLRRLDAVRDAVLEAYMDPNATLDEILMRATSIALQHGRHESVESFRADCIRLAELIEMLDHWITGGGYLPYRWQRPADAIGKDARG